jgi:hypothetical protein
MGNQQNPNQKGNTPNPGGEKTQQRPGQQGQPNQNKNSGTGNNPQTGRDQSKF